MDLIMSLKIDKCVIAPLFGTYIVAIARLIFNKKINLDEIKNTTDFKAIIDTLGLTKDDALEVYINRFLEKFSIIRECLAQKEYESAILLLYTVIEGEINTALRIILRIHNFSHAAITDTIRGVDFKSKINVLFPLLGINLKDRFHQFSRESQQIRNLVVHFHANPEIWTDVENNDSCSYTKNQEKAKEFFQKNPIDRLEKDISIFVSECVFSLPEVQAASELFHRYLETD